MLDRLEAEIVDLRARNSALVQGTATPAKKPAKRRKPASSRKAANKGAVVEGAATNRVGAKTAEKPEKPATGKRQALGRSIIQLRRATSAGASDQ